MRAANEANREGDGMSAIPRMIAALLLLLPAGALATTHTERAQLRPQDIDVRFLQLSPADPSLLQGASLDMRLLLALPHERPVDVTRFVTRWISSKPMVASVDRRGEVNGLRVGSVKITADLGFFQATTLLNVVVPPSVKFSVQPSDTAVGAVISPGVNLQVLDDQARPVAG